MAGSRRPSRAAAVITAGALALAGAGTAAASSASVTASHSASHSAAHSASHSRPAAATGGQLTTYGYDNARDGHDPREPSFAHLKAAWSDGDNVISGGIYGQPLVVGKLVIVATESDKVYALSAATGKVAWSYTVGTPARLSTIDSAPTLNSSCGDIDPLGITGTPVIDPAHSELYVAAEVQTGSTTSPTWQGIQHVMVALKFTATGVKLAWKHQIDPPGASKTYYIPAEQQRSALTLANGRVYAEYGGLNGDCGSYQGYVVSMASSGVGALSSWKVPTAREGAIWATDGAATGLGGELFVATGNSNNDSGKFDYGDAIIGLSPSLKIDGYFAPSDWAQRNADDLDLGSGGPTLLPGSTLLFETGKHAVNGDSAGYLMLRNKLGGVGHPAFTGTVCPGSVNVYGANAAETITVSGQERHYLFVPCPGGTVALRVTYGSKPSFRRVWAASGPNGTPIIAGGLVWALATDANFGSGPEDLYGMSPVTGKVRVTEQVRPVEHFATPGAGDGMIYVASQIGVQAFRPAAAPASRSGVAGHRVAAAPPPGRLLTYGYDNGRNGIGPRTPSLTRLRKAWTDGSKIIAGGIYGQPLVDGRLVIVATEDNKVYGLNAATGKVAWRYSVGAPARLATIDKTPTLSPGCGDVDPLGITGTPVISPAAGEVLVAAEVQGRPARPRWRSIRHVLVALKFTATGVRLAWRHAIDPPGGAGRVYYIPAEQQRSALTLSHGRVYAEYGGLFGDCGKYQGYVVSLAASGQGRLRSWKVPTVREGAIWATDGAAVSPRGELYVATGNSNNDSGRFDYGDAVIGLSPGLRIDGYFAPRDWARRNADDLDLGSGGPVLLPGSHLLFESGKPAVSGVSTGFLLGQSRLGRIGHPRFSGQVCPGGGYVFGAEAAERLRKGGPVYVYVPCSGGTVALRVSYGAHPRFSRAWAARGPNGTPIIAGGLVWALATGADGGGGPSELVGMRPLTGRVVVREPVRPVEHFATPGAGDGMIFVATASGVQAFKPAD